MSGDEPQDSADGSNDPGRERSHPPRHHTVDSGTPESVEKGNSNGSIEEGNSPETDGINPAERAGVTN